MAADGPVLGRRALGRATLDRQGLLDRTHTSVPDLLERLVGLQGQVPGVPYTALWSRLADFDPATLSAAMADRSVVRAPLMRTTLHTVTARDALALQPLMAPVLARTFASTAWGKRLRGVDLGEAFTVARELVAERPRTRAELGGLLGARFPDLDGTSLGWAFGYLEPVVQATPRGLWRRSGPPAFTTMAAWLGAPPSAMAVSELVRRYLAGFGPASVRDAQAWCGLTRLREVTDTIDLRRYRAEDGTELLDLPDAAVPDPDVPAPVRFLPEYDNALLGYADRSRMGVGPLVVSPPTHGPGGALGTVLVDGVVAATWMLRHDDGARLTVTPSGPLGTGARDAVDAEAAAVARFLTTGEEATVVVDDPV
ncbi:winged helix DNA-binding domain-containing protein [Georgenia yuyongxinii]|uniref:Winged helix DNA-binding domain-containing protein n=1 Tax=Georgenia yuyongxinii TaxID=2589797 RepID=A0A552WY77_9MICO|nr:winged helix DNA-binding domain-containing protein [Georgenia yuyongxinii]TRW47283.1 winged helix DNA-binding domain-containing protein [Georgenia yuyongxinii]